MQRAAVSQAAAAKMALANVLVDEPGLPRAASVPRSVPASPALSGGAMSSLAASPLPAAQAPTGAQGTAPAKKLSFFENSLFSQVPRARARLTLEEIQHIVYPLTAAGATVRHG